MCRVGRQTLHTHCWRGKIDRCRGNHTDRRAAVLIVWIVIVSSAIKRMCTQFCA